MVTPRSGVNSFEPNIKISAIKQIIQSQMQLVDQNLKLFLPSFKEFVKLEFLSRMQAWKND